MSHEHAEVVCDTLPYERALPTGCPGAQHPIQQVQHRTICTKPFQGCQVKGHRNDRFLIPHWVSARQAWRLRSAGHHDFNSKTHRVEQAVEQQLPAGWATLS
jgi:hypothetical protein